MRELRCKTVISILVLGFVLLFQTSLLFAATVSQPEESQQGNGILATITYRNVEEAEGKLIVYKSFLDDKVQIKAALDSLKNNDDVSEIVTFNGKSISNTEYSDYAGRLNHNVNDSEGKKLTDTTPDNNLKGIDLNDNKIINNPSDNNNDKTDVITNLDIKVLINGKSVVFKGSDPYMKDMRYMVPARYIFEILGANVYFRDYGDVKICQAVLNGVKIDFKIGDERVYRNGKVLFMEVPPEILNGRTYISIRSAAEIIGMYVSYDAINKTIKITNKVVNLNAK